jgi:hypothetical protein
MHQQIRTVPALSPPSVNDFLGVLEDAGINIEAAGGGNLEGDGGEFAFAVAHGVEQDAMRVLRAKGYEPRLVDVVHCALTNEPGQLRACIAKVTAANAGTGRVIRDISIGVPDDQGRIQVQIYSA